MRRYAETVVVVFVLYAVSPCFVFSQEPANQAPQVDVGPVPTPQHIVELMLALAKVKPSDLVYDLGCGDGRIVVTAASVYGCEAVGFDIDPDCVRESRANVAKANVEHLVTIEQRDIFELDLSEADVVTLYLLSRLNEKLLPQLEELKPGSRIVSHDFDIPGVEPDMEVECYSRLHGTRDRVYVWTTPLKRVIGETSSEEEDLRSKPLLSYGTATIAFVLFCAFLLWSVQKLFRLKLTLSVEKCGPASNQGEA